MSDIRSCGPGVAFECLVQQFIVVWYNNPHAEGAADEKEHQSPDKGRVRFGHQSARVLCLAGCHGDKLWADHSCMC